MKSAELSLHGNLRLAARAAAANPTVKVVCRKAYAPFVMGATYDARPFTDAAGRAGYRIRVNGIVHVAGAGCFARADAIAA